MPCYPISKHIMPSTREEPRQWQWIFRALWSAAPKATFNAHEQQDGVATSETSLDSSSSGRMQCHLQLLVPDTILFERGEPCKWVGCSPEGIVVRKSFFRASSSSVGFGDESVSSIAAGHAGEVEFAARHPTLTARVAARRPKRTLDDFEVAERLDTIIAAFLSFAAPGSPSLSKSLSVGLDVTNDVPVCVARYNDGTTELLSGKSLKTLCKFYNWRASLCALQAYVHPSHETTTKTRIGKYTRRYRNRLAPRPTNADAQPLGDESSTPKSTTITTSEGQLVGGPQTVTAGDVPSTPSSQQASTTALDHATKDVAFVTDMTYAWPAESLGTASRSGHGSAAGINSNGSQEREDTRSPEDQQDEMRGGGRAVVTRPVFVVGGQSGEPRCHPPPWPKSRIRISRLEAEFAVDHAGRPWFTNASKV